MIFNGTSAFWFVYYRHCIVHSRLLFTQRKNNTKNQNERYGRGPNFIEIWNEYDFLELFFYKFFFFSYKYYICCIFHSLFLSVDSIRLFSSFFPWNSLLRYSKPTELWKELEEWNIEYLKKTINNNKPKCNDFLIRNSDLLFGLRKEFGSAKFWHFCVKKSLLE